MFAMALLHDARQTTLHKLDWLHSNGGPACSHLTKE
jgi:hypothetical protein